MSKTESVEIQVRKLLEEYNENFSKLVKKVAESTAKETAEVMGNAFSGFHAPSAGQLPTM